LLFLSPKHPIGGDSPRPTDDDDRRRRPTTTTDDDRHRHTDHTDPGGRAELALERGDWIA